MQIYVQCNKKTMTKLIKKMENCSESSFIFICKNLPSGVATMDRTPGNGVRLGRETARPSVGVQAMVTNPLNGFLLGFVKNERGVPTRIASRSPSDKQTGRFHFWTIPFIITPDDFWVRNESSILGAIFHLIK